MHDHLDLRDYDEIDAREALVADDLRSLLTGLPVRPGTRR